MISQQGDNDIIWCIHNDIYRNQYKLRLPTRSREFANVSKVVFLPGMSG